jgi:thiol:disulfide interchange protein DsbD
MNLTGTFTDYFVVFASGVVVSFTPCLYPVLPITAAVIAGVNTKGTRIAGFALSCIYVLGLAVCYGGLGVVAVLTGHFFGHLQSSPYLYFFVSAVLVLFALMMLDVVRVPFFDIGVQGKIKPRNVGGIFLLGLVAGLIVGPCTAPMLGTLLLYVASKQNLVHAISLLFVFSFGVGFSLILVGTFSGLLAKLPRSGSWLSRVKQFCAIILFLAGAIIFIKAITLM